MERNRKYKVIISDSAKAMLEAHICYIARISKSAAATKKKTIMTALRSLVWMPQRFPFFEEAHIPPGTYRKMTIPGYHLILYQIKKDTVYVDYILDCRTNYFWLIHS